MVLLMLIFSALLAAVIYYYITFKIRYQFWKKRNVPYIEPTFPVGNMSDSFKQKHFAYTSQEFYNQLKHQSDYGGVFFFKKPLLILTPEFAKTILVKDFNYFVDRGVYFNKEDDPLSANLFFIEGDEWRHLRSKLSQTFTSRKMKLMFHIMLEVAENFVAHISSLASSNSDQSIEIREYLARYTTDVIGSCAFGINCNSIVDPDSEFRAMGKKMFNNSKLKNLKLFLGMLLPKQARALRLISNDGEVTNFLMQIVEKTIKHRKDNDIKRNDFMQLMINLYKDETEEATEDSLTLKEIAAQSFLFFFAGFETSATTMTYALHELSLNPEIQNKLRNEVNESVEKNGGTFTYDSIVAMTYMDQVINESLRKHPPVATIHRILNKNYKLPNGSVIPEGTFVLIPTYAFHHDPDIYPNPSKFDPDRFSEENKSTRHPFSHLPFGEGQRICLGLRFGLMQVKVGLAMLLRNFKFEICDKSNVTLEIDNVHMLFLPIGEVWLNVKKI